MVCCLNLSKMNFEIRQKENDLRNWAWCRRSRPRNYCCCCCWLMSCQVGPNSGSAKGRGILELRFVISPVKEKIAKVNVWVKKIETNSSSLPLLRFVSVFLTQTLLPICYFFQINEVVMPIHMTPTYKHEINSYSNHSKVWSL